MSTSPKKPPVEKNVDAIDVESSLFAPVGDETRTVGGESVSGFVREGNDIPQKKKILLGEFLAAKTSVNVFPITPDLYVESSATGPNGLPTKLTAKLPDFQKTFTNPNRGKNPFTGQSDPANDLDGYSLSGAGTGDEEAISWVQNNVAKGKDDDTKQYDGNTLLRYVVGQKQPGTGKFRDAESGDVVGNSYTSKVLQHNRFTPRAPAADDSSLAIQSKFGIYDPDAKRLSAETAALIGPTLTLRAAGELGADKSGFSPPDKLDVRTILPGKAQLGLAQIDGAVLEAASVLRDISGGIPGALTGLESFETQALPNSRGQVNTYADPFSGLLPAGMSALAIALLLSAQLAIDAFALVISGISDTTSASAKTRDKLGRYTLGSAYTVPRGAKIGIPLPATIFGVQPTRNTYEECLSRGIEVFFNVGLSKTISEPGFYVVLLRTILSSAPVLVGKAKEIFGSGNPFNIVASVTSFVEAIRTSKLLAAMNVFARLGDTILTAEVLGTIDGDRVSDVDALPSYLPGSAIAKSRDQDSLRLAWRASAAPMSVLLPSTLRAAGSSKQLSIKLSAMNRAYAGINTMHSPVGAGENKIPLEKLRALETRLEAEYVPFYFHDTRTNEIISFHAFLTTLTDNFTTNHDTTDAYGRIDQIKIYKNTTRAVNVSFHVVSTNEDDFDFMWAKINKLITLVYPQWSEGLVKRRANGDSFVQPFSQVPSASPLVRLRVGDVIKSNYSRFALKRIFGYGSSNFAYTPTDGSGKVTEQSLRDEDKKTTESYANYRKSQASFATTVKQRSRIDEIQLGDNYLLRPAPIAGYASRTLRSTTQNLHNKLPVRVKVQTITLDNDIYVSDETGSTYVVTMSDLIDIRDNDSANVRSSNAMSKAGRTDGLDKSFFNPGSQNSGPDPKANTIVRSFESTMSKGLACVINSINFNWLEGTTWETEIFGSRAPKVVKIDMSLTPFHDIAPGIDAYGANRAPVYGVGQFASPLADDDIEGEQQFDKLRTSMWGRK